MNIISSIALNRLISGGLIQTCSHTEKLCISSYYIQFSTNIEMYNLSFISPYLEHIGAKKTGFNLIVHSYLRGNCYKTPQGQLTTSN